MLFAYVVFLLLVLWLGVCVEVDVDTITVSPPPPSPLPIFRPFFVPAHNSLLNTSDSYLKSVRAYEITTWVNDLIDPNIQ